MPFGEEIRDVEKELDSAVQKWGAENDDCRNSPMEWAGYLSRYSTNWLDGGHFPWSAQTVDKFRHSMVQCAAIALAAIQSLDRQRRENGVPFYQDETAEFQISGSFSFPPPPVIIGDHCVTIDEDGRAWWSPADEKPE